VWTAAICASFSDVGTLIVAALLGLGENGRHAFA